MLMRSPGARAWLASVLLLPAAAFLAGCGAEPPASANPASAREADPASVDAAGPSRVRAAQRVRVAEVRRAPVGGLSDVAGVTSAFRTATVSAEVAARVVERHVEPGARVAAGDPLVTLDDALLAIAVDEARATLKARHVDLEEARLELARLDDLRREGAVSERQHDAQRFAKERAESAWALANASLRRARRSLADAQVRAPFDGTVERVDVQVGDYLTPGAPVAAVADFARVRLRAGVTAAEAADLRPGMTARVAIPVLGGVEIEAAIHSVGLLADPSSGTYPVELWLDNEDGRLRAGMVAQLGLDAPEQAVGAVVPRAALLRRSGALAIFVVEGAGDSLRAVSRPVRLGRQSGDLVELLEGARVGDRVVVDGLFALTDGAPVYIDAALANSEPASWND
ncbi:MAG: efflux RND transporter periplasmic adaptor subunit [Myxococcota bacterium]|nr:efflux RND transporter periplasmic adaptor subunit [Myxococcota bacterium]